MTDHVTSVLERRAQRERAHRETRSSAVEAPPGITERWLVPLMWVAVGVIAVITTPEPEARPPLLQAAIGEALGWAALVAMIGLVTAAMNGQASLRTWSLGVGAVGLVGLVACQLFGHPVFSSSWGLSQVLAVSAGLLVTANLMASPR